MMCTTSSLCELLIVIEPPGSHSQNRIVDLHKEKSLSLTLMRALICLAMGVSTASPRTGPWLCSSISKPTTSGPRTLNHRVLPHNKTNEPKSSNIAWKWQFQHNFLHFRYQSAPRNANFPLLQFPVNNSAPMLRKRPTAQLRKKIFKIYTGNRVRLPEIVLTCDLECARKLGAQTWYIVEPRPVDDNGRRIFVGSSVRGDGREVCVSIVQSGANGRAMAPRSPQQERHSQELFLHAKNQQTDYEAPGFRVHFLLHSSVSYW